MDETIVALESRLAFHEQGLQELNDVLTDQQRQLDQLRAAVQALEARLSGLMAEQRPSRSGG